MVCENFPFHIEGKRCQALKPEEWMEQSKRDCPAGKIPAVFFRRNGRKEWLVIMTADSVCELARQIAPSNVTIEYAQNQPTHTTVAKGFYVQQPDISITNPNK